MSHAGVTGRRVRAAVLAVLTAVAAPAAAAPLAPAPVVIGVGVAPADGPGDPAATDPHHDPYHAAGFAARVSGEMPTFMAPVARYVTTAVFGQRGRHWTTRHTGLDFEAPRGTPVYAVHNGTVVKLAWHKAYGRMVILEVSPGVTIWYCHLSAVTVELGPVRLGQQLGRIGSTGNAFGPHLHLEVRVDDRPTDPAVYVFGEPPGSTGRPPSWLPPKPIVTVANLATLKHRSGWARG